MTRQVDKNKNDSGQPSGDVGAGIPAGVTKQSDRPPEKLWWQEFLDAIFK